MCYTLYTPIICTLQIISRTVIMILLAVEDLIRLFVKTVHNYVSIIFNCLAILPMCFAFCCVKKCYQKNICSTGCYPKMGYNSCGCTFLIIAMFIVFLIIFYFYLIQDFLQSVGIKFPCNIYYNLKKGIYNLQNKFKFDTCTSLSNKTQKRAANEYDIFDHLNINATNSTKDTGQFDDYFDINLKELNKEKSEVDIGAMYDDGTERFLNESIYSRQVENVSLENIEETGVDLINNTIIIK